MTFSRHFCDTAQEHLRLLQHFLIHISVTDLFNIICYYFFRLEMASQNKTIYFFFLFLASQLPGVNWAPEKEERYKNTLLLKKLCFTSPPPFFLLLLLLLSFKKTTLALVCYLYIPVSRRTHTLFFSQKMRTPFPLFSKHLKLEHLLFPVV